MAVLSNDVIMMPSSTNMTLLAGSTEVTPRDPNAFNNSAFVTIIPGCLVPRKSNSSFIPWNNPENLISQAVENQVHVAINVYVLTVLFCVSVPANAINMLVFWKQGLKERINLCLFSLALTDFVTVCFYFSLYLGDIVTEFTPSAPSPKTFKFFVNNSLTVMAASGYMSWFLCLVLAVERCVCVVFPLRASSLISTRAMLIIIVTAALVIVGCFSVVAARVRVGCVVDPVSGAVTDTFLPSQFYLDNEELVEWVEGVGFGMILFGVCLFGVAIATTITVLQLRVVSRWRGLAMAGSATKSSSTPASAIVNTSTASLPASGSTSTTARSTQDDSSSSVKTSSTFVNTSAKFGETSSTPVNTSANSGETSSTPVNTSTKFGETSSTPGNTSAKSGKISSTLVNTSAKSVKTSSTSAPTSASSVSSRELALTRMLVAISVFFIVLTTPLFVVRVVFLVVPEVDVGGKYHNLHMALLRMDNLCFYLNATVNFFVYCVTGSRFRKTLCSFFPGCGNTAPKSRSRSVQLRQNTCTTTM